ncbi:MAG: hypothetical protein GY756_04065 [bacterium]|nr:hypothetical protein [bacterium]
MKKNITLLMLGIFSLLMVGCVGTFDYTASPNMVKAKKQTNYSVVVKDFKDVRPLYGSSAGYWIAYLPLMPYGTTVYNRPEKGKMYLGSVHFQFVPTRDLAKASFVSLKESKLFNSVLYATGPNIGKDTTFTFTGDILSTYHNQKALTYCLSVFGSLFWFVGAPAGITINELEVNFMLINNKTNKIVWSYLAKNKDVSAEWLYVGGVDCNGFAKAMKKNMNEAILDLENQMKK